MNNFSTPVTKIKPLTPDMPWNTLIFSVVILGVALILYAGIRFGYRPFIEGATKRAENRIVELDRTAPQENLQTGFIQFYSQLTNIRDLLSRHTAVTPFFDTLAMNTKEGIGFADMAIDVNNRTVSMSGFAKSYDVLAGQLAIYENIAGVDRASLSSARQVDRLIQFDLRLDLSSDLLKLTLQTITPGDASGDEPQVDGPIEQPLEPPIVR